MFKQFEEAGKYLEENFIRTDVVTDFPGCDVYELKNGNQVNWVCDIDGSDIDYETSKDYIEHLDNNWIYIEYCPKDDNPIQFYIMKYEANFGKKYNFKNVATVVNKELEDEDEEIWG